MQFVFLVGGRGTRLGSLTDATPKPLLPIGDRPFLDILIERAAGFGATEVLLLAGYHGGQFAERYESWPQPRIRWLIEPAPLGTGGALAAAAEHLAPTFFLVNGDTLFDADPRPLRLDAADCVGRLALRRVAPAERYETVVLEGDRITEFRARAAVPEGLINAGLYALRREILDWIPAGACSLERDVFPRLAAAGKLEGRELDGFFIDIGVPDDYARAQALLARSPPA